MSETRLRYSDAVAEALRLEMHRDPAVVFLARDQGAGDAGPAGATEGFAALFGERFVQLAVSSDVILGTAAGAAAAGLRPICEMPLADFGAGALGELTRVAELCRAERLELPILIRVPLGGYSSSGPGARALDPETWLLGLEEVRVVAPATPEDVRGMIASALRHPGPVCLLEHEALGQIVDAVPEGSHQTPLDQANVMRAGDRLTLIASGPAALLARSAADQLDGAVEVIDLRSLQPLDDATILASVAHTGRAVIVTEADRSFRVAGEVAALITERAFECLDAPVRRAVIPPPVTADLHSNGTTPTATSRIKDVCDELLAY